jgi:hypothetical protein
MWALRAEESTANCLVAAIETNAKKYVEQPYTDTLNR